MFQIRRTALLCAVLMLGSQLLAQPPGDGTVLPDGRVVSTTTASLDGKQAASPPLVSENSLGNFLTTNEMANELAKATLPFWAMLFGLMALFFLYKLSARQLISAPDTPRFFVLTLIIVSALIFICGKFENKEITPAIGLFGTIAGYVLGRSDRKEAGREGESVPSK